MNNKFPRFASKEQTIKILSIINNEDLSKLSDRISINNITIGDIFNYLPHSITYNGHRGDLSISVVDIAYFSVGGGWEHVLVHFEDIPIGGDVFDAFIKMLEWLKENNLLTKNE